MIGKLLVTGGSGQVARAIEDAALVRGIPTSRVGRPEFDFDRPETLAEALDQHRPALVVNAAAYTAVDAAETDVEAAYRANRDGPGRLAALCAAQGIRLIHISTDYVFDGSKGAPYVETDPTDPTGVYGASKLAGEREVFSALPEAIVLRTSWVYAPEGRNFVRTMLRAAEKTRHLRVVADQIGCPTTAQDLAEAILDIAGRDGPPGLYHAAGSGWTSWHGLAVAIFQEAARHGVVAPTVEPIATADWPTPAARPADSRLDCGLLARCFDVRLPEWRASLARSIDAVFKGQRASPAAPP
jgi:dTDP-4-dehydrorhamnose reductase